MNAFRPRAGYMFLMSVLFIGAIALSSLLTLMILGWAAEQGGLTYSQSQQALNYARSCAEYALQSLRADSTYAGSGALSFTGGACKIFGIDGAGSENRTICTEGDVATLVKLMRISATKLFPSTYITSFTELYTGSGCTF
ncbi:hypothetical protein HYR82_04295 [Candidatus Peregrinibacteria bacterium]|nr:hypothetical protein [Candidatus Peregrinibacteria bacterium]